MKDYHIHTKYSDGEYNENQIIEKVISAGVTDFAICDHDTFEGSKKVFDIIKNSVNDIKFHSGIELSCNTNYFKKPVNMHILIHDYNYEDEDVISFIETISSLRLIKLKRMIEFVEKEYNIKVNMQDVNKLLAQTNTIGKPHIYKVISKYHDINREDYYNKMNNLKTNDLKLCAEDVVKKLSAKNYQVTLAHPIEIMEEYNFTFDDIDILVGYLKQLGLNGLEVYHSKQTKQQQKIFLGIANKYNLRATYGSDFHGENVKPNVYIGKCYKD